MVIVGVLLGDAIWLGVKGVPGGDGQRLSAEVPVGDAILLGVEGVPGGDGQSLSTHFTPGGRQLWNPEYTFQWNI